MVGRACGRLEAGDFEDLAAWVLDARYRAEICRGLANGSLLARPVDGGFRFELAEPPGEIYQPAFYAEPMAAGD